MRTYEGSVSVFAPTTHEISPLSIGDEQVRTKKRFKGAACCLTHNCRVQMALSHMV